MKRKARDDVGNGSGGSSGGANDGENKDKRPAIREKNPSAADDVVVESLSNSATSNSNRPTPKYGSKEYWEARYKSHLPDVDAVSEIAAAEKSAASSEIDNDTAGGDQNDYVLDGVVLSKEATKPGHEWYFSYDELRPLILPLILEDADIEQDAESWAEAEEEEEEGEWVEEEGEEGESGEKLVEKDSEGANVSKEAIDQNENQDESMEGDSEAGDQADDVEEDDDQADDAWAGIDTTNHQPKRVLEVGCGDKPLGTSLASDLTSMQSVTGFGAELVVKEVLCIDYSEIVVKSLLENQTSTSSKDGTKVESQKCNNLQATFQALDARSLPFPSNTYDIILEKGTLDAMLSDEEEGVSNCIKIMKEMARVTSEGGSILIVSHLNASEPKGMGWLEDVVFRGLKDEFLERQQLKKDKKQSDGDDEKVYVWSVEVHGGDGKYLDANGDEIDDPDDDDIPIYGPAVYIVKKKWVPASIAKELFGKKKKGSSAQEEEKEKNGERRGEEQDEDDNNEEEGELLEMPPVKLSYVTYGDE